METSGSLPRSTRNNSHRYAAVPSDRESHVLREDGVVDSGEGIKFQRRLHFGNGLL